jgi:hypothetical protein
VRGPEPKPSTETIREATDIAGYRSGGARLHYRLIGVIWRFGDFPFKWPRQFPVTPFFCLIEDYDRQTALAVPRYVAAIPYDFGERLEELP